MQFSKELRDQVMAGDITVSFRLWQRPQVKEGGRYWVGPAEIEVDSVDLMPFAAITPEDVRRSGEPDLETLRQMVSANVGITLLPALAVKPPVAQSPNVSLVAFEAPAPSRRIAMLWRKSSAMTPFFQALAAVIRDVPAGLFDTHEWASGQREGASAVGVPSSKTVR